MLRLLQGLCGLSLAAAMVLSGCDIKPPTSAIRPVRSTGQPDWKRSAVWLYATKKTTSGVAPECASVYEALQAESRCAGALCRIGADLTGEWLDKCAEHSPKSAASARELAAELSERARREPTPCALQFTELTEKGCQPAQCAAAAQQWATACGETESGPLGVHMVEQVVRRRTGASVELDARSCASLTKQLRESSSCADETACKEALPTAEAYRARCEDAERKPDTVTAVALLAVIVGAGQQAKPVPIAGEAEQLPVGSVPLTLVDGSGAVLGLCRQRPVELDAFLALRERCRGTTLTVARLFVGKQGQPAMRVGRYVVPQISGPPTPYPWLEVAGERAKLVQEKATGLRAALDALPTTTDPAAVAQLVKLVEDYGDWIGHSRVVRAVMADQDEKLGGLLASVARAKVAAARTMRDRRQLMGLKHRADTRALADVASDGSIEAGAATAAFWLDTSRLLPKSMVAYRKALEPLKLRLRFGLPLSSADRADAEDTARGSARLCGREQTRQYEAEQQLTACVFSPCKESRHAALIDQWHGARQRAEQARRELDLALSPLGTGALLSQLGSENGCESPRF